MMAYDITAESVHTKAHPSSIKITWTEDGDNGHRERVHFADYTDVCGWVIESLPEALEEIDVRPDHNGEPVETTYEMAVEDFVPHGLTERDWHEYLTQKGVDIAPLSNE